MENEPATQPYTIVYRFTFENGSRREFTIRLHPETLELILPEEPARPEWTRLKFQQCEGCPLGDDEEYCPVAVNLGDLVSNFENAVSYDKTSVTVVTKERVYEKETTVQKGLSAIIGIYMVVSNCPIMDTLRPMVRFHLPFASVVETSYRAITMYLLAQFFRMHRGLSADWEMKKLTDIYKQIAHVNKGISQRVSVASSKDAGVNAVVILNSLGDSVPYAIENGLADLESLFRGYLQEAAEAGDAEEPPK